MLIFGEPWEGSPNDKSYELYYEDGEQYSERGFGSVPERQWDLSVAIGIANANSGRGGETLLVVDPETRAVLWQGRPVTR